MRKTILATIAAFMVLVIITGCAGDNGSETNDYTDSAVETELSNNNPNAAPSYLSKAPSLTVSLTSDNLTVHDIQALQLTTSWSYEDGDEVRGYLTDSPHPLQISDYSEATLNMGGSAGEIVLQFSDNYPPQSISVQRWDASLATGEQNIADKLDYSTPVEINENKIPVSSDGSDYIYEVYARWSEGSSSGSSYYSFRTESMSIRAPLDELPADYSVEQAIDDGVYVHGIERFNQDVVEAFHEKVSTGRAAFMRVMNYTLEGDAIITDYEYDGSIFTVRDDTTRDKFGNQGIATMTFNYLVRLDWDSPVYFSEPYYLLSNEEDVFTIAENGAKTKFIDGLFWMPTPPSEWGLKIGSVTAVSNGNTYEPYVHFMYSKSGGGLFADGFDFYADEVSQDLQIIDCGDDFEVIIDGGDISSCRYMLFDDAFNILSLTDFVLPSETGIYLLCVDVIWSNNETDTELLEYTGNRYVFKISV